MGLGHSSNGLMIDDQSSNSFRLLTNDTMIGKIINGASSGIFESRSKPEVFLPSKCINIQGVARSKE